MLRSLQCLVIRSLVTLFPHPCVVLPSLLIGLRCLQAYLPSRRPQDGPKSRQERPKRRPRAARSAPKGPQARPWAPKVRQEALREAPGAHFGLILGGPGPHFKQFSCPFRSSRALRQTIENTLRNHWSKGLLSVWPAFGSRKRNHDEGVHAFSGQDFLVYESNWPPRRVFSHVGPQKPLVFTWLRAFQAVLRPPVAPRG